MLIDYVAGNSVMHRLHPLTKIIWTFFVLFMSFLSNSPVFLAALLLSNCLIGALSGIFGRLLPIMKGLFIFSLILIVCQIFFVNDGRTLFYVLPFAELGQVTDQGLHLSVMMSLRMVTTVSTIPLLMMTTRMNDLASAMTVNLRLPYQYVFMFLTALQFIPAYIAEMKRILKAQMARGYHSDTGNAFKKVAVIFPLAVPLLVMAVRRVQTRAVSMEIRGFGRKGRTHFRVVKKSGLDLAAVAVMVAVLGAVTLTVYL